MDTAAPCARDGREEYPRRVFRVGDGRIATMATDGDERRGELWDGRLGATYTGEAGPQVVLGLGVRAESAVGRATVVPANRGTARAVHVV